MEKIPELQRQQMLLGKIKITICTFNACSFIWKTLITNLPVKAIMIEYNGGAIGTHAFYGTWK